MTDNIRLVRYYKNRFKSTTDGAVHQKEYTGRTEIQRLTLVNKNVDGKIQSVEEWQTLPIIDIEG